MVEVAIGSPGAGRVSRRGVSTVCSTVVTTVALLPHVDNATAQGATAAIPRRPVQGLGTGVCAAAELARNRRPRDQGPVLRSLPPRTQTTLNSTYCSPHVAAAACTTGFLHLRTDNSRAVQL